MRKTGNLALTTRNNFIIFYILHQPFRKNNQKIVTVQTRTPARQTKASLMMVYDSLSMDLRETAGIKILLPVWHVF